MKLQFIELENYDIDPKDKKQPRLPASYVRKKIKLRDGCGIQKAELIMTALGVYEPYINGGAVTDDVLLPGFTNYHRQLQYQTYDVTSMLRSGENELMVIVGDGWYRGNVGAFNNKFAFGTKLAVAAKLIVTYEDETREVIDTDESWEATQEAPLRENDLKTAECYDARLEGTRLEGTWIVGTTAVWHPCKKTSYAGKLVPMMVESVREQEIFTPEVVHTPDGSTVLDFGQNIVGWVHFTVGKEGMASAGRTISLQMGETLDEQGNFTLGNLQGDGKNEMLLVNQKLTYIMKDGVQKYHPHFLISGFRYTKVENWPEEVVPENFTAVAVYSALSYRGNFTCSNDMVNQFVENVRWAMKSNFVDIPTDCPHRERAGWAGDVNVFLESADYLADTRAFMNKWMSDFIAAQKDSGALPYIIPEIPAFGAGDSSAGWADAIATVPMMQYRFYGDDTLIRQSYDAVKRFVEYNRKRAKKKHVTHLLKTGEHYRYILDTGFHYGEWLEPGSSNITGGIKAMLKPDEEVATAWFFYTTKLLVEMAGILGNERDEKEYRLLAEHIQDAYHREFLRDGKVVSDRQCKYVRPVYMGLVEGKEAQGIVDTLNEMIIANDYKIGTGFLTTYQVLQVLSDYGHGDTAYKMLTQTNCPGWLYEIAKGATTTWEGWDAITEDGKIKPLSQNHYSPGAIVAWLFRHCAGIRPAKPGFEEILIQPVIGRELDRVHATYPSVKGEIVVDWHTEGNQFEMKLQVPEGVTTTLVLPNGDTKENVVSGRYTCEL